MDYETLIVSIIFILFGISLIFYRKKYAYYVCENSVQILFKYNYDEKYLKNIEILCIFMGLFFTFLPILAVLAG